MSLVRVVYQGEAMVKKYSYDIFLSYSSKDKPWVSEFASVLRDAGVKTWFDFSELLPGERWQEKIQDALRNSKILVIILSANSVGSPWTFFELGAAVADRKGIIPVLTGDVDLKHIAPLLLQFQFLKETSPKEAGKRVAETIEKFERELEEEPASEVSETALLSEQALAEELEQA